MMRLEFFYNVRGFGELRLMEGDMMIDSYLCRTGSIGHDGKLKNGLPVGDYVIIEPSVNTDELGMYIHKGAGWKIRLYRVQKDGQLKRTRLLVHPDGNKPGTLGCIGIQGTDAISFRHELDGALKMFGRIPVIVKQEKDA
jgi:hypothetical protein